MHAIPTFQRSLPFLIRTGHRPARLAYALRPSHGELAWLAKPAARLCASFQVYHAGNPIVSRRLLSHKSSQSFARLSREDSQLLSHSHQQSCYTLPLSIIDSPLTHWSHCTLNYTIYPSMMNGQMCVIRQSNRSGQACSTLSSCKLCVFRPKRLSRRICRVDSSTCNGGRDEIVNGWSDLASLVASYTRKY